MYRLMYGILYLFSLCPFWVIYRIGDLLYLLLYYVIGYRKKLVISHIEQAFPDKSAKERVQIMKHFFRNFVDTWLEMIKILSMSETTARKRIKVDFQVLESLYKTGTSCQLYTGHFMNWEYLNVCIPLMQPFPFLAIYMPLSNPAMEKIVFQLRSKFGTKLLKAGSVKEEFKQYCPSQYMMGLGADQSPPSPEKAFWLNYLNKPTGFVPGPWEKAISLNQPSFYLKFRRLKRGYYFIQVVSFEPEPATKSATYLVQKFAQYLEEDIREAPSLYLWSHKRWKKPWKPEYAKMWIDEKNQIPSGS